jgi:hypothetical protein
MWHCSICTSCFRKCLSHPHSTGSSVCVKQRHFPSSLFSPPSRRPIRKSCPIVISPVAWLGGLCKSFVPGNSNRSTSYSNRSGLGFSLPALRYVNASTAGANSSAVSLGVLLPRESRPHDQPALAMRSPRNSWPRDVDCKIFSSDRTARIGTYCLLHRQQDALVGILSTTLSPRVP